MIEFQYLIRPAPTVERQIHLFAVCDRAFDLIHLIEPLLHGPGFDRHFLIVIDFSPHGKAFDGDFQPPDLALLNAIQLLLPGKSFFLIHDVFSVITNESGDLPIFDLGNMCGNGIEYVAVMRNDDHRARVFDDELFKKRLARHIEVIVRFIEQQHRWVRQ